MNELRQSSEREGNSCFPFLDNLSVVAIPLRIVGHGFMEHGFAKLSKKLGLQAIGAPASFQGRGFEESITSVDNYKVGTVIVNMFDGNFEQLIWPGTRAAICRGKPEKNTKTLDKDVQNMFKKFTTKVVNAVPFQVWAANSDLSGRRLVRHARLEQR